MWQRIHDAAIDRKKRIKLIGRIDSFRLCKQLETNGIPLKIETTPACHDIQFLELGGRNHFGTRPSGVYTGIVHCGHIAHDLHASYLHRFGSDEIPDHFTIQIHIRSQEKLI